MKVDPNVVKEKLAKVQVQFHRFPNTYAVIATATDEKGFCLGTGVGACVDPNEFREEIGQQVAKENALKAAEDKLWEIEGILLMERLKGTKVTTVQDAVAIANKVKAHIYRDPQDSQRIVNIMFTPENFAEFIDLMQPESTTFNNFAKYVALLQETSVNTDDYKELTKHIYNRMQAERVERVKWEDLTGFEQERFIKAVTDSIIKLNTFKEANKTLPLQSHFDKSVF